MRTDERLLDPSILALLRDDDPLGVVKLHREYLAAIFVLVKNSLIFELNNPALHNACARAAGVANTVREYGEHAGAIAFLPDGVYVNQTLLKLTGSVFEQGEYLHAIWSELGVGEIEAVAETAQADWLDLSRRLKQAVITREPEPLRDVKLERIHLTPIDAASHSENVAVSERFRALRAYSLTYLAIDELLRRIDNGARLRVVEVKRALQQVIDVARGCPDLLMAMVHMKRHKIDVAHHLTNTAVLVITAAQSLGLSRRELVELAVQAVLHDAGAAFSPAGATDDDAAAEWVRRWVGAATIRYRNLGRLVVANESRLWIEPPADAGAAYRWPLWNASRLVAVAHAYDRMTTPTADRPALLPDEALRVLLADAGRRFDPLAVKLLVNEVGVYPVGSTVSLSDGRIAIVVEASRGGLAPRVKIVGDLGGETLDGAVLDVGPTSGLSILGCVDPEERAINTPAFLLG